MNTSKIYLNQAPANWMNRKVTGNYVDIEGETFYRIANFDAMEPFFMSIVSDSDHWMYIWTNGALSAGRRNADNALFPYYTDDKIRDSADITGSKTILRLERDGRTFLWEPFSDRYGGIYSTERNCYKNIAGNKLIFEEINNDLQLCFRYAWMNSEQYGFIKKSSLRNLSDRRLRADLLDGLQNILPAGVGQEFQNAFSTLVDAYKKSELESDVNLGIYALSSIPVDRAEPSEALKANTVWSCGIEPEAVLLSSRQLEVFRRGRAIRRETDMRAARGAYFIKIAPQLDPGQDRSWYFAADLEKDLADVVTLKNLLNGHSNLPELIEQDVARGTERLIKIVARADGLQSTADTLITSRHFSNVLFNVMRGGIFDNGYQIDPLDFADFVKTANHPLYQEFAPALKDLSIGLDHSGLINWARSQANPGLERLAYEYLPLTFSRRHGDPSRPWNRFSIDIKNDQGQKVFNYQGNWRDIFQNWEALGFSYPGYLESMITRFVNASTADGYNPYRLTRDGVDWEVLEPGNPWSYIGYWGDHQIIYLLKLLELSQKFHPDKLAAMLTREIFVYANVPYRIKKFDHILADPFDTVDFDAELQGQIEERVAVVGSDGKLLTDDNGQIYRVNLFEKLLLPVLVKLSNFIPGGGIWMNTQRPEWNDANNALVGNGLSMVTLYYLRRHISFLIDLFKSADQPMVSLSGQVALFLKKTRHVLRANSRLQGGNLSNRDRRRIVQQLGQAGSDYRTAVYREGFSGPKAETGLDEIIGFFESALQWIDQSIRANCRDDGLYHAYNLIENLNDDELSVRHLYEMLEGQTAVLSSGLLAADEVAGLLDALRKSRLYRADQFTYILYPDRSLPRFTEKNTLPQQAVIRSKLIQKLLDLDHQGIVKRDPNGDVHFNSVFRNAGLLKEGLRGLPADLQPLAEKEQGLLLEIYEDMFDHRSFTGRSGTFFKYEGLGSIYWHMVSKLLLAVQENCLRLAGMNASAALLDDLRQHYYEIKEGIGVHKSPGLYGGFPTDPYSHTPAHAGAQQPGMTGQVKEDILSRFGELGVEIERGQIRFNPVLLKKTEFLTQQAEFHFYDVRGGAQSLALQAGSLAYTLAQVPVVYHLAEEAAITITFADGRGQSVRGSRLDEQLSAALFSRNGKIERVDVYLDSGKLSD